MKSKDWHLYNENGRTFEYPKWMNHCSLSPQYRQTFRQLSKTLLLLVAIVMINLKLDHQ